MKKHEKTPGDHPISNDNTSKSGSPSIYEHLVHVDATNEEDIIIETYTPGINMKLTHMPTGKTVSGTDKSLFKLKQRLLKQLEALVKDTT